MFSQLAVSLQFYKSWKTPNRNISNQLYTLAKQIILMRDKNIAKMGANNSVKYEAQRG